MSSPIDSNDFYTAVGPGSKFSALFDPLICSKHDLANHFYDGLVAANGGGQQGQACATYILQAVSQMSQKYPSCSPQLLLCVVLQESSGNCFVQSTLDADGNGTLGIMQCEGSPQWTPGTPMNQGLVTAMVDAGAQHLASNFSNPGENGYTALRLYNSGSVAPSGNLNDCPKDKNGNNIGTPLYVVSVANRLHGWSN